MPKQKIRIRLKGYDHKIVDQSAAQIVEAIERSGAVVSGPSAAYADREIQRYPLHPLSIKILRSNLRSGLTSG